MTKMTRSWSMSRLVLVLVLDLVLVAADVLASVEMMLTTQQMERMLLLMLMVILVCHQRLPIHDHLENALLVKRLALDDAVVMCNCYYCSDGC